MRLLTLVGGGGALDERASCAASAARSVQACLATQASRSSVTNATPLETHRRLARAAAASEEQPACFVLPGPPQSAALLLLLLESRLRVCLELFPTVVYRASASAIVRGEYNL